MSEEPLTKKPRLSGEDFKKLKEKLREKKKLLKNIPRIVLNDVGKKALLSNKNSNKPISISDIQQLILYSLLGHHSPFNEMKWCKLEKYNHISHVSVLVIEGLSSQDYLEHESILKVIESNLDNRLEFISPLSYGGSITEELIAVPISGVQKFKLLRKFESMDVALERSVDLIKLFKIIFPTDQGKWFFKICMLNATLFKIFKMLFVIHAP